ncbi:MAG TPA: cytochrome c [Fimbriiglobus sp.]|jgi:mono/diheme cytochrome c family protein
MVEGARLSVRGKWALFAAPVVLVVGGVAGGRIVYGQLQPADPPVAVAAPDGAALFQKNCAVCHGPEGKGDGTAVISPRARYFGFDKFRFSTTPNGMPCPDDFARLLAHGIPGSAMPKFETLHPDDVAALYHHVRALARDGVFERWRRKVLKDDPDDPDLTLAAKKVEAETAEQPCLVPPSLPAVRNLANGRRIFTTSCAPCHGPQGKGDGPQEQKTDDGTPIRPRDLTTGIYKGGGRTQDLYARIVLGIPGTPMPATTTLSFQDLADLIGFVQSLAKNNPAGTVQK